MPDTASHTKPGYKTSEFWLAAIYGLVTLLNQSGAFAHPLPADTIMAAGQAVAVYVASRSGVKAMSAYVAAKGKPVDAGRLNQ